MSIKTVINIKADREVKKQAQDIARRLGVPLSSVVNSFLKQFIRSEEVTFSSAPKMTAELEATLDGIEADRKKGRNFSKPLAVAEAIEHLSAL